MYKQAHYIQGVVHIHAFLSFTQADAFTNMYTYARIMSDPNTVLALGKFDS